MFTMPFESSLQVRDEDKREPARLFCESGGEVLDLLLGFRV